MKTWDVIIVGGGIIGLSLAIALRKRGASVLLIERGAPAQEASHAAAGMLAAGDPELPAVLRPLAEASAAMYPEFVHELQDESGIKVDLRDQGTLVLAQDGHTASHGQAVQLSEVEPALAQNGANAMLLHERSVDPRALGAAALKAAKHRNVDLVTGAAVTAILQEAGRVRGVSTGKTSYTAAAVVNCAGAWAGQIGRQSFPTRPVKGQMLALVGAPALRHVIRAPEIYLVPRSDGRIVVGSTLEEAGYDKRVDPDTILRLQHAAIGLVPALAKARVHEAWAGLRPGTPDKLPLLGASSNPGYFVAAGHYRDGILLAPVTAETMACVVSGADSGFNLSAFSPLRFQG